MRPLKASVAFASTSFREKGLCSGGNQGNGLGIFPPVSCDEVTVFIKGYACPVFRIFLKNIPSQQQIAVFPITGNDAGFRRPDDAQGNNGISLVYFIADKSHEIFFLNRRRFAGAGHPSNLLNALFFGTFNKRIPDEKTQMDWLTKEERIVDAYLEDPLCGFTFTVNGFQTLLELLNRLHKRENLEKMPRELPVLFVAGEEDPVGNYGKGVKKAYQSFLDIGMKNVKMKLYENDRHELLNEMDREQVYGELYSWMQSVL